MANKLAEGLASIAQAFQGLNNYFQITKLAQDIGAPAGVTDPALLSLFMAKKKLDNDTLTSSALAQLYGAKTTRVGSRGGGSGSGMMSYDYFVDPETGQIVAVPKKVKAGETPTAIPTNLPLGAAKAGTKGVKPPQPEKPGLIQRLGSIFSSNEQSNPAQASTTQTNALEKLRARKAGGGG